MSVGAVGNTVLKFVLLKSILSGDGRRGREGGRARRGKERGGEESDIKEKIKVDNYLSISSTQQSTQPVILW